MSHIAHILSHAPHMNALSSSYEWLIHDSESCPAHEWLKKGLYKERPSRKKKFTGKFPTTLGSIQYAETPCILRLFFCKISLFWLLLTGSFVIDIKHLESIQYEKAPCILICLSDSISIYSRVLSLTLLRLTPSILGVYRENIKRLPIFLLIFPSPGFFRIREQRYITH